MHKQQQGAAHSSTGAAQQHSNRLRWINLEFGAWYLNGEPANTAAMRPARGLDRSWSIVDANGAPIRMDGIKTFFKTKRLAEAFLAQLEHLAGPARYILRALPEGSNDPLRESPMTSMPLTTAECAKVQAAARADGWHSFRRVMDTNAVPDFASTLNR